MHRRFTSSGSRFCAAASAQVLHWARTCQTAYARFPLLCTPSRTLCQTAWPLEARNACSEQGRVYNVFAVNETWCIQSGNVPMKTKCFHVYFWAMRLHHFVALLTLIPSFSLSRCRQRCSSSPTRTMRKGRTSPTAKPWSATSLPRPGYVCYSCTVLLRKGDVYQQEKIA